MKVSDNFIQCISYDDCRSIVIDLLDLPPALRKSVYKAVVDVCSGIDKELSKRTTVGVC